MNDDQKDGSKGKARVVRLGAQRPPDGTWQPIHTTEALAILAGALTAFENAAQQGGTDPAAAQARVAELATMRSATGGKTPLMLRRGDSEPPATEIAAATPFTSLRRPKPEPK